MSCTIFYMRTYLALANVAAVPFSLGATALHPQAAELDVLVRSSGDYCVAYASERDVDAAYARNLAEQGADNADPRINYPLELDAGLKPTEIEGYRVVAFAKKEAVKPGDWEERRDAASRAYSTLNQEMEFTRPGSVEHLTRLLVQLATLQTVSGFHEAVSPQMVECVRLAPEAPGTPEQTPQTPQTPEAPKGSSLSEPAKIAIGVLVPLLAILGIVAANFFQR